MQGFSAQEHIPWQSASNSQTKLFSFCCKLFSQQKETLLFNDWRLRQADKGAKYVKKIFGKRDKSDIVIYHRVCAPVCEVLQFLYL
jgi:hypothetical protein